MLIPLHQSSQDLNLRIMFVDFIKSIFLCKFRHYFKMKRKLGQGAFGKVYLVSRRNDSCNLATKILTKSRVSHLTSSPTEGLIPLEIDCVNGLRHENVVSVFGYMELHFHWVIVMEYCASSVDLFDFIAVRGPLHEDLARHLFLQLHSAVSYCLSVGVDHRDIKDENILINTLNHTIKLIDFGSASHFKEQTPYTYARGTSICLPPEYHLSGTYYPLDATIWAYGCVLFKMIQGFHPFCDYNEIVGLRPDIHFVSLGCKDLLRMCLAKNPKRRIEFASIAAHPWCCDGEDHLDD